MSLPDDYLRYPKRRHGMDHDLYPWSDLFARKPVRWPNGARVALMVSPAIEFFPLNPTGKPFKAPGSMQTPYPDLRHYSTRDYGNRVGIFRLYRLFAELGIPATVSVNAIICERYPQLLEETLKAGHEIVAQGLHMDALHYGGMDDALEIAQITESLRLLRRYAPIHGWLSPAKSQSAFTLEHLVRNDIRYCMDWAHDELPTRMHSKAGEIIAMPHSVELSDRQLLSEYKHSEDSYVEQLKDAFDWLYAESKTHGGRLLTLPLSGFVTGLPYRISALKEALSYMLKRPGVWPASASAILHAWTESEA